MPTGDLPGWNEVFSDDFDTASSLVWPQWQIYGGDQPPGDPGAWWDASHATLKDSILKLRGYQDPSDGSPAGAWATTGVKDRTAQLYGKWEVHARMDNGRGIAPVILLWPESNRWPDDGEIDFAEDGGQDPRATDYMTVHYACGSDQDCNIQQSTPVDWSEWHTYGVEWTPGKIVITVDGKNVATDTSHVPDVPMNLAIQDQDGRSFEMYVLGLVPERNNAAGSRLRYRLGCRVLASQLVQRPISLL